MLSLLFILAAFLTSTLTSACGIGGGTLLFVFLSRFLSLPATLITHGIAQAVQDLIRTILNRKNIEYKLVIPFFMGSFFSSAMALSVLDQSLFLGWPRFYHIAFGVCVLILTWFPPRIRGLNREVKYLLIGLISTLASLFMGLGGLFISPFLIDDVKTEKFVGNLAVTQLITHVAKLFILFRLGFGLGPETWDLSAGLALGTILGTPVGLKILKTIPKNKFNMTFKLVVSIIALKGFIP